MKTEMLLKEIAPFLNVAFEEGEDGKLDILDEGHERDSRAIREAVKRFFRDNHADLHDKVAAHTSDTFYKATERTPPFVILFLACGKITPEEYVEKILEAPSDAEIVCNYIAEDKFVDTLFDCYRMLKAAREGALSAPTEVEIKGKKIELKPIEEERRKVLDTILGSYGLPSYGDILESFSEVSGVMSKVESLKTTLEAEKKASTKEIKSLQKAISDMGKELAAKPFKEAEVKGDGTIPSGKVVMKKVADVFDISTKANFDVPVWEWDGIHPDVPAKDPYYIFREDLLVKALYAILSNQRMYLQGHTGSGKTTLIEQIAAHLNWPFARINFDSEITRMDLIGRDTLKDGKSVFVDGVLPRLMTSGYITCFDEIDFCRPDVAYVMQSVLEGNSFRITEDGGRLVEPNPMFRMFATGNTVGQGDEHGMYQGARPQSLAFLDRFTIWGQVNYLDETARAALITRHASSLNEQETTIINKYVTEHLTAFEQAKILQPISPRGMLAVAKAIVHLNTVYPGGKTNVKEAFNMVILDRCTQADRAVIKGLIDRVVK